MPDLFWDQNSNDTSGRSRILIVEGKDDAHFFDHLLSTLGADPALVRIIPARGKNALQPALRQVVNSRDFVTGLISHVAVVVDADTNPSASLAEQQGYLASVGLASPSHAGFVTTNIEGADRTTGLFLIPSDLHEGMLEQVLLASIAGAPLLSIVEAALASAEQAVGELDRRSKRLMSMYLALSNYECMACGLAFKRGAFDPMANELSDLRAFITAFIA